VFLSRNLYQNAPKNTYVLEKAVKITAASEALPPNLPVAGEGGGALPPDPVLLLPPTVTVLCRVRF